MGRGNRLRKKCTYAITPVAIRFTGRRHISKRTSGGTLANDRSSAIGCFAGNASPDLMSCKGICVRIRVKSDFRVQFAVSDS